MQSCRRQNWIVTTTRGCIKMNANVTATYRIQEDLCIVYIYRRIQTMSYADVSFLL